MAVHHRQPLVTAHLGPGCPGKGLQVQDPPVGVGGQNLASEAATSGCWGREDWGGVGEVQHLVEIGGAAEEVGAGISQGDGAGADPLIGAQLIPDHAAYSLAAGDLPRGADVQPAQDVAIRGIPEIGAGVADGHRPSRGQAAIAAGGSGASFLAVHLEHIVVDPNIGPNFIKSAHPGNCLHLIEPPVAAIGVSLAANEGAGGFIIGVHRHVPLGIGNGAHATLGDWGDDTPRVSASGVSSLEDIIVDPDIGPNLVPVSSAWDCLDGIDLPRRAIGQRPAIIDVAAGGIIDINRGIGHGIDHRTHTAGRLDTGWLLA